jgi:hypothetical protein
MLDSRDKMQGFYNCIDGDGFGDYDNDAYENEKDQKAINFSFRSGYQIVGVVITFPEFRSVKFKIFYATKSGSRNEVGRRQMRDKIAQTGPGAGLSSSCFLFTCE